MSPPTGPGSDALPGVAIAVSLVPPLATVGVCLELGRLDDAAGALLLFTTNFAAIVVVGCIVFALAGARPHPEHADEARRLRLGFAIAFVALVLIALPLAWGAVATVEDQATALEGAPVVRAWIGDRDLTVTDYSIDGDRIELLLAGASVPTDVPALADQLAATLGHTVDLTVEYVPRIRVEAAAPD